MKIFFSLFVFILTFSSLFAAVENPSDFGLASEVDTASGTQVIIPEDIDWTQRFILTELKELRIDLEAQKRELNQQLNERELRTVDRALAYSGNMVNFLWLILTMAVTGFGLVGWRTMKDVRENLTANFEKEVQKRVSVHQKKLEEFMQKFEEEQLAQSQEIIKNQEIIQFKQEAAYLWSQYNREDNPAHKIELLDRIAAYEFEKDVSDILSEKAGIYIDLGIWDKALEMSEKGLEIEPENATFLYYKAQSLVMLEDTDSAIMVLTHILGLNPSMKEELLENPVFENLSGEIETIVQDNSQS